MNKILLSGGRPTGKLHLGHYIGAFKQYTEIQEQYKPFFIVSDLHMMTTKTDKDDIDKIHENAVNMVIDSIGMGIDPNRTTFYLQSNIKGITDIFILFQNLINFERPLKTPSLIEMSKHSKSEEISLGLISYPIMEAGDIFALDADIVPVGKDNVDHILITQEIIETINKKYNSSFKIPQYLTNEKNNYIVGIDGNEKMSKSLDNAIYIRDDSESVKKKIFQMKWSNNYDENIVIKYLELFAENDPTAKKLIQEFFYGSCLESEAKNMLYITIENLLKPMRERMKLYLHNPQLADRLLEEGTKRAQLIVNNKLKLLKEAMGLFTYK